MNYENSFLHKNGLVTIGLAREFILMHEGDKINTVEEYSSKFNVGRGTVQSVLKFLESENTISLHRRGHLGTFITYIDYKKMWKYTNYSTIVGVMPLPYSKLYEGLATGLHNKLNENEFSMALAYMRGADTRVQGLLSKRYDFAIISKLAAKHLIAEGNEIEIVIEFGPRTYVNKHVLIFAEKGKKEIENGMKVGIDKNSKDQYMLSVEECRGKEVEFIEMSYNLVISKILSKEIDAAVWNLDEIKEKHHKISYMELTKHKESDSEEAVLVVDKGNDDIKRVIEKFINAKEVIDIQKQVIKGEVIPNY